MTKELETEVMLQINQIGDMSDEGVRMRGHTSHRRHERRRRMRDTSLHIGDMNDEGVQMRGQILHIGDMSDTG